MKKLLAIVALVVVVGSMLQAPSDAHNDRRAGCGAEDMFLKVASGNYSATEGWDHWHCAHAEDFVPEYIEQNYRQGEVYSTVIGSVCEHRRFWRRQGIEPAVSEACDH